MADEPDRAATIDRPTERGAIAGRIAGRIATPAAEIDAGAVATKAHAKRLIITLDNGGLDQDQRSAAAKQWPRRSVARGGLLGGLGLCRQAVTAE